MGGIRVPSQRMDWLGTSDYDLAREVLQRGVAAVFVIAFLSSLLQFPALLGERGLLPAPRFLARAYARRQPTRSEERRVGKECGYQCRSRWSPYH